MCKFMMGIFLLGFALAKIPPLDFEIVKTTNPTQPTLLLLAGIQGDEPGGFNAASVFLRHYKITHGNVWVVPALNRHSMFLNHRGIYGDMNRKFDQLTDENDPEIPIINKIKDLIMNPDVDAILHLHDGSGFYRPVYVNKDMNPNRWGACCIIDQEYLQGSKFPELGKIINNVIQHINSHLIIPSHTYHKRDTQTAKGDKEMERALTYFAIRHLKSAFANEASKNLSLEMRVYYHLLALEGLLRELGIEFERDFKLTPNRLYYIINDRNLKVNIQNSITLPLYGLKEELNYFPLPTKDIFEIKTISQTHIVGLVPKDNQVYLKYGNKLMTRLRPHFIEFDDSLPSIGAIIDGEEKEIKTGSIVDVKNSFKIINLPDEYRVNIIGFVKPGDTSKYPNEKDIEITLKSCIPRFSIDKKNKIYRAEFYKGDLFSGMVLFKFE